MEAAPRASSVAQSSRKRSAQPSEAASASSSRAGRRELEADESIEFIGERPAQKRKKQHGSSGNAVASGSVLNPRKQQQQSGTSSSAIVIPATPPSAARASAAVAAPAPSQAAAVQAAEASSSRKRARSSKSRSKSASVDAPARVDKGKQRSIDMPPIVEDAPQKEQPVAAGEASTDTVASLKAELEGLRKQLVAKDAFIDNSRSCVEHVYNLATCTICLELAWRPHVLTCGHVFCAGCLIGWFQKRLPDEPAPPGFMHGAELAEFERRATLARDKVCPSCRASVVGRPVEVWMIKGMLEKLDDAHRAGHGEGGEDAEERSAEQIKEQRHEELPQGAALWKDIFREKGVKPKIIHDIDDGVDRCGECANEVVQGECIGCGIVYSDMDDDDDDFSDDEDGMQIVDHIHQQMHLNALAAAGHHFVGSDDEGDVQIFGDDSDLESLSGDEDERENRYMDTDEEDSDAEEAVFDDGAQQGHHPNFESDDDGGALQSDSDGDSVVVRRVRAPVIRIDDSDDDEVVFGGRVLHAPLVDDDEEEEDEDAEAAAEDEDAPSGTDDDDADRAEAHLGDGDSDTQDGFDDADDDEEQQGGYSSDDEPDINERRRLAFEAFQRRHRDDSDDDEDNDNDSGGEAEGDL